MTADLAYGRSAPEIAWDGIARGYIPRGPTLRIDPSLQLHEEASEDIDPISYEVIRYSLMNLNFEHTGLISRLCVSPVTMVTRDFQTAVLTEVGDLVFLGPAAVYFANAMSLCIKWSLENRSANPGIHPGDMFLSNDPYVGAPHQPDTNLVAPCFVDGKLFCWVANVLHHSDVGGSQPGSICVNASDIWTDPPCFPPIKVVEAGELRVDVEELFMRQSRLPAAVAMDLRAAIAGNNATIDKVLQLVAQYGAPTVKAVMRRTLDAAELVFVKRLSHVPDGKWSHRIYTEVATPGDRGVYRYQMNVEKRGEYLHVDNVGTDPQVGSINVTFVAFAGAFLGALAAEMVSDLAGAYGGIYRRVIFNPVPGTLSCADFPAAVSPSGAYTNELNLCCAASVIGKMLLSGDEEARALMLGPSIPHFNAVIYSGFNRKGDFYVMPNTNGMMGSTGATSRADGVDTGGHFWIPEGLAFDVEQIERQYPVLYLYRRMLSEGADGAGKYRGGLGFLEASMPWGGSDLTMQMYTDESFPKSDGQFGGNPGSRGTFRVMRGSNAHQQLERGRVPQSLEELTGAKQSPEFKGPPLLIEPDDVWEWSSPAAAGFGDPLLRKPAAVGLDIENGLLDSATAARVFGVVADDDGNVDDSATVSARLEARASRLRRVGETGVAASDIEQRVKAVGAVRLVGAVLGIRGSTSEGHFVCGECGHQLGRTVENFKSGCVLFESRFGEVTPEFDSVHREISAKMVYRQFLCPSCGIRVDTEIAGDGDPILWDVRFGPTLTPAGANQAEKDGNVEQADKDG
jgi:N-methylhydantoinase B